jgi:hypothetical protein
LYQGTNRQARDGTTVLDAHQDCRRRPSCGAMRLTAPPPSAPSLDLDACPAVLSARCREASLPIAAMRPLADRTFTRVRLPDPRIS